MEQTKTKKALIMSVLSMVLCIAMLIGMTFAWFTDTASTGVNKIQAGNLDVDIIDETSNTHIDTLKFTKAGTTDAEATAAILWEPGCRYVTEGFRIASKGSLALKWKAEINKDNITNGSTAGEVKDGKSLLDVIDFYVVKSTDENAKAVNIEDFTGHLTADQNTSEVYYIKGVMQTTAGNDYQNLTLDGITITVYATQDTVENDSYNNQYDADAALASNLKNALAAGGNVTVSKDTIVSDNDTVAARNIIKKPTTLNLDKKIISPDNMGNNNTNFVALIVDADTTINAGANGGIDTGNNGGYAINIREGANLTINGGTYYGGGTAAQVQEGTLTITGGHFAVEPYSDPTYGYNFLLNCIDSAYKNGTAKIIVKGGTFVNFDPSNNTAEGPGTNFVAEGYKVVAETHDSDTWYKVVKE